MHEGPRDQSAEQSSGETRWKSSAHAKRMMQPKSKSEAAYQQLRHEIRSGELAPGQRVTLQGLSRSLSMSLTPVREALNQLEAEGFVVHMPYRGSFIAETGADRVEQIYRLREVLEPMAVSLAAERVARGGMEERMEQVRSLLHACDEAITPFDVVQTNEEFHQALYRLSDDPLLIDFISKLWAGVPYQSLSLSGMGDRVAESSREHHALVEAVAAGDAQGAADVLKQHIQHGRRAALENL